MAGRPRLVHEGSPIIDEGRSGFHSSAAATPWSDGARANDSHLPNDLAGFARAADNASARASATSKPFKLQTRLVVGGGSDDDEDVDMMMDEDEHDHNQRGSNQGGYAGHQNHHDHGDNGHHGQQHQHATHHQHQTHSTKNEFFNNDHNFQSSNPVHYAPPPPPPLDIHNPLVVLDAANIAYNYAESLHPCQGSQRRQPDPRGIRLAIDYFVRNGCRVQAVVPTRWYQLKPHPADHHHLKNRGLGDSDARMVTEEVEQLRGLRQQGFLVACPPGDDDDAYAIALARREDDRVVERRGMQQDEPMVMEEDAHLPEAVLGGWVASNDFFQDAVRRDGKKHQHYPLNARPVSLKSWLGEKRISYSFANVGTSGVDGEIQLEFLPNPRNDLIEAIDACNRSNCSGR